MGEVSVLLAANARLIRDVTAEADAGRPPDSAESGALKVITTRNAVEAVRLCVSLAGHHALTRGNPLERHWRDVQCGLVHVPQADSAMTAWGQRMLDG